MKGKIKGFDGIRGLAVLSVILTHLHVWKYLEDHGFISSSVIPMITGGTGVQAFFILSGFLITILLIKEHETTGRISIKNFIMRRVLRIFPLYILFLTVVTVIHVLCHNVTTWQSLVYAYFYLYNFVPRAIYTSFLGHTWSLAVEEHFYLVWPILFSLLLARKKALIVPVLVIGVCGSLILHYVLVKAGFGEEYFVSRWSFIAGYNISFGCLAAIVLNSGKNAVKIRNIFKTYVSFFVGLLLYANSLYFHTGFWFVDNAVSGYIRSAGILLMIVWMFLNQGNYLVKMLEFAPLRYIGLISYGIYMFQGLFLGTGPERAPGQNWPPSPLVGLICLLICAPLSYHYFEKPILRLKKRFSVGY